MDESENLGRSGKCTLFVHLTFVWVYCEDLQNLRTAEAKSFIQRSDKRLLERMDASSDGVLLLEYSTPILVGSQISRFGGAQAANGIDLQRLRGVSTSTHQI